MQGCIQNGAAPWRKVPLIATRLLLLFVLTATMYGQYTGPAMLTRGEMPSFMQSMKVDFRPYLQLNGIYDTGMVGVTGDSGAGTNVYGVEASFGIYGVHRSKRSSLGLDYRGNLRHYAKSSYFDGSDHTISLGLALQTSRHSRLNIRESAGTFTRSFGMFAYGGAGTFDPTLGYLPANDYFDNRTDFLSNQVDFVYQKSARLSFSAGGDLYLVHYRSKALHGLTGTGARGDISYRISRHSSLSLGYNYSRYTFSGDVGGTDLHSLVASYGVRLGRDIEIAVYGGAVRAESQFLRLIGLDPAIAALLGTRTQLALTYRRDNGVQTGARLVRHFRHSQLSFNGSRGITPGNGVFLTSQVTSGSAGYSYSGLRRWNVGAGVSYSRSEAISDITGNYNNLSGGLGATRQLAHGCHLSLRWDVRQYNSGTFGRYDRLLYRATVGLAFTPKDIPLTLW